MAAESLNQAAAARHQRTVERAERALRELDAEGAAISFQAVALRAGVSRQWLHIQPGLRQEIEALRDRDPVRTDSVPARQRASEASLRQRLQSLRDENQRLREENHSLKTELALAYGQQRERRPLHDLRSLAPAHPTRRRLDSTLALTLGATNVR